MEWYVEDAAASLSNRNHQGLLEKLKKFSKHFNNIPAISMIQAVFVRTALT